MGRGVKWRVSKAEKRKRNETKCHKYKIKCKLKADRAIDTIQMDSERGGGKKSVQRGRRAGRAAERSTEERERERQAERHGRQIKAESEFIERICRLQSAADSVWPVCVCLYLMYVCICVSMCVCVCGGCVYAVFAFN